MSIKAKQDSLDKLLKELEQGQKEMSAGPVSQQRGEELEAKALEAEALQAEIKQFNRLAGVIGAGRAVDSPILPTGQPASKGSPDEVVGYLTLGEAFTQSDEYKSFAAQGFPAAREIVIPFDGARFTKSFGHGKVPVTRKDLEQKAVSVTANVIRRDRDMDSVRLPADQDRLLIRDVLNVAQTDSNMIEYLTWTLTRAAAPVADGDVKPEANLAADTATAPVRTIAVTTPITEQMLQDVPNVQNTIDNELTYDLKKVEEQQIVWGAGTGQNLLGFFGAGSGVALGRTVAGDTLIDLIKRSQTDVIVAGGDPNAVAIDPVDWETVILTKGTDNHYIWTIVTDDNGSRLWGMRVIETVAMREPGTFTTNERRFLVGDFRRGATLWDRQQAAMQIGWVNDQFRRNQRTIRLEERLAFGIKRPFYFRYRITQARVA
jgi:HK97 family phage major capsid protein